jgi:hypothetical protein
MSSSDVPTFEARAGAPLAALRRFARKRAEPEPCELCGAGIRDDHPHLLNPAERKLFCACEACAILLSGGPGARFRRVPRRVRFWPDFRLGDVQWASLHIPIDLAFFFHSTSADKVVVLYPGAAGAIESSPPADAWRELAAENPQLDELEPDVEALLVNRVRGAREAYFAPIDECYRLVGLIRSRWRGLSGGAEVWRAVESFFTDLKQRSEPAPENRNA